MDSALRWFLLSRGVMGPVVALVAMLFLAAGIEFSAEDQVLVTKSWGTLVNSIVVLAGVVTGLIGRIKAKTQVTLLPPVLVDPQ